MNLAALGLDSTKYNASRLGGSGNPHNHDIAVVGVDQYLYWPTAALTLVPTTW